MAISVRCECGYSFGVGSEHAGKTIRCPDCRDAVRVPSRRKRKASRSRAPVASQDDEQPRRRRSADRSAPRKKAAIPPILIGGIALAVLVGGGILVVSVLNSEGEKEVAGDAAAKNENIPAPGEVWKPKKLVQLPANAGNTGTNAGNANTIATDPRRNNGGRQFVDGAGKTVVSGRNVNSNAGAAASGDPFRAAMSSNADVALVTPGRDAGFVRVAGVWFARMELPEDIRLSASARRHQAKSEIPFDREPASRQKAPVTSQVNFVRSGPDFVELYDPDYQMRHILRRDGAEQIVLRPPPVIRPKPGQKITLQVQTARKSTWRPLQWQAGKPSWTTRLPRAWPLVPRFRPNGMKELIRLVEMSVVRIDVITSEGVGNGSGYLMDSSGRVVTNYHVLEGAIQAGVMFRNGERYPIVGFLHLDPKRDLAIIQAHMPKGHFPGLDLCQSVPEKGEKVVAFGAPLGLDYTASDGIISSIRTGEELEARLGIKNKKGIWIQTSAPISPGNSGGPLVNSAGQVVALNTMTLTVGQNLNFAVGADSIRNARLLDVPKPISPRSIPYVISEKPSEKAPAGLPPGSIGVAEIEGQDKAKEFLAKLSEVRVEVAVKAQPDARPVIEQICKTAAAKALKAGQVKSVIDEGPVLIVLAEVTGQSLSLAAHIYFPDTEKRTLYRIWRNTGDIGELTVRMMRNRRLSGTARKNLSEFFGDLSEKLVAAKNIGAEATK